MLKDILSVVPNGNQRYLGGYTRLLDTITTRMTVAADKFKFVTLPHTPAVENLEWILYNLNEAEIKKYGQDNDFELFTEYLSKKAEESVLVFDPVLTKTLYKGKYYKCRSGSHPTEIMLNCTVDSPISKLPFDENPHEWMKVRAIRNLYYDSIELPIDLNSGYANFVNHNPTFAVMSINVPVLMMKWIKWKRIWARGSSEQVTVRTFLKEEFKLFFNDYVDIWVTRLLYTVLTHKDATAKAIVDELDMPKFIADKGVIEIGVRQVQEVLNLIDNRNLKFQDFMSCKFYPNGRTIRDYIVDLSENVVVPDGIAYMWLDAIKWLPTFQIVTAVMDRDPKNPLYQQVMRKAYWIWMHRIRTTNLPNLQFAGPVRNYLNMSLKLISNVFESKIDPAVDNTTQT